MKEAFELIIERLKLPQGVAKRCLDFKVAKAYGNAIEIVKEVAEKCNDRIFINGQCCWQSCACTEKCQECNRYTLNDSDIDWYESIEAWDDEFGTDINVGSKDGWIPISSGNLPIKGEVVMCTLFVQSQQRRLVTHVMYDDVWLVGDAIITAWQPLPEPYEPKGE